MELSPEHLGSTFPLFDLSSFSCVRQQSISDTVPKFSCSLLSFTGCTLSHKSLLKMVRCAKKGEKWEKITSLNAVKPPYLFRAASDDPDTSTSSRGLNTKNVIDPLSGAYWKYGMQQVYHDNIASIDSIKNMICDHINYNYYAPSEFSSWSVSLLFVLQHALRKAYALGENNVLVYAMDTTNLPSSRIYYAPDLLRHYDLDRTKYGHGPSTLSDFTQGEYLVHGYLSNEKGLWQAVELRCLRPSIDTVFPSLKVTVGKDVLLGRVRQIRERAFGTNAILPINPEIMHGIVKMAKQFGKAFEGAVALALFTSRQQDLSQVRLGQLCQYFASLQLPVLCEQLDPAAQLALQSIHSKWQLVYEARHFMELLLLLDDLAKHGGLRPAGASALSSQLPIAHQLRTLRMQAYLGGRYTSTVDEL